MSWSKYADFLAFAVVLVLVPGPDFAVVTKNTLAGGRRRGRLSPARITDPRSTPTHVIFGMSII
jgi:hypothetical protein